MLVVFNLSLILVAIALVAVVTVGAQDVSKKVEQWTQQNYALSSSWIKYQVLYDRSPETISQLFQQLSLPLRLPGNFRLAQITQGFQGWCFEGKVKGSDLVALQILNNRYPTQYGLSDQCGTEGGISTTWSAALEQPGPVPVVLTFKFSK